MDELEQAIASKQAEVDQSKKQIEKFTNRHQRLVIELEVLKQAARLRPTTSSAAKANGVVPAKAVRKFSRAHHGRQRGAISTDWRNVLAVIRSMHRRVAYDDIHKVAVDQGIETKMPNVRERVRSMVENGLLSGNADLGFLVTADAVRRFDLEGEATEAEHRAG
jgi:hypothetical protein